MGYRVLDRPRPREVVPHGPRPKVRRRGQVARVGQAHVRYARPDLERERFAPQRYKTPSRGAVIRTAGGLLTRGLLLIEIADLIGNEVESLYKLPTQVPNPGRGWVLTGKCPTIGRAEANNWTAFTSYPGPVSSAQADNCLSGQATGAPNMPVVTLVTHQRVDFNKAVFNPSTGAWRSTRLETWGRPETNPGIGPSMWSYGYLPPAINPNVVRASPAEAPAEWPQAATPVAEPVAWQWWSGTGPPPVQHSSQPPRKGEKENKNRSTAARVGQYGWRLLDNVSELSEIAGALYDALPEGVREKWGCAKGVNIGQYGSDFNTCKMQALLHNWHSLDGRQAFMNIAKNVAEDMTIGAFHKFLSKISPPGFSWQKTAVTHLTSKLEVEAYISKRLKELFRFLGLE